MVIGARRLRAGEIAGPLAGNDSHAAVEGLDLNSSILVQLSPFDRSHLNGPWTGSNEKVRKNSGKIGENNQIGPIMSAEQTIEMHETDAQPRHFPVP